MNPTHAKWRLSTEFEDGHVAPQTFTSADAAIAAAQAAQNETDTPEQLVWVTMDTGGLTAQASDGTTYEIEEQA